MTRRIAIIAASTLLALSACSETDDTAADAGQDGGADDAVAEDTGLDLTPDPSCTDDSWLVQIFGSVLGADGMPLQSIAKAQTCIRSATGLLTCLRPADTTADGSFTVTVPENVRCMARATMRTLVPLTDSTTSYCELEIGEASGRLTIDEPIVVFPTERPASLNDIGDGTVSRTVTYPSTLEVDLTPDALSAGGSRDPYLETSAAQVAPAADGTCFATEGIQWIDFFGFSPEADVDGGAFAARFPNTTGLAPGTAVDLYVLGGLDSTDAEGERIEEGVWHRAGTGTVGESGLIEFDSDNGLSALTWAGLAVAQ